jgi:membrane-bound lytic murein transglycosylase D
MMARNRTVFLAGVIACLVFGGLRLPASPAGPASDAAGAVFSTSSVSTASPIHRNLAAPQKPRPDIHSAEADQRIQRSDQHLNAGKQLYFKGDLSGARREFDASIDALLNAPEDLPDRRRIEAQLDRITDLVYRFDIEKLGAGETNSEAAAFDQAPIDQISGMTFPVDQSLLPKVDFELKQTASAIPLELTDPVLSYIHYFSSDRGRKVLLAGFQRAGRYKPMIQRILAEEGVPQELIYLAEAESGFLPRAVSWAHAVGMWQFIPGTGQLYDLTRTNKIDERFDPPKATRAAARMLKDLYQRYGDWYLAMAAYNCGPLNVDRAVERTGYADYWELLKLHALPKETSNYVPIIVAMTIMAKNPKDYGLEDIQEDPPIQYEDMKVNVATNIQLIADAAEQPVSVVRDLNPALLGNIAPAGTEIHMPLGTAQTTLAALESVPSSNRESWRLHHVVAGDTLQAIAHEYNTSAGRILEVNQGADSLDAGDVLLIPAVYHPPARQIRRTVRRKLTSSHASSRRASSHNVRSRNVSPSVLHRRAAVRTASLSH